MSKHEPIYVKADGQNVKCEVYDTLSGIGAAFKGQHYTAWSRGALERKLQAAAKSNAHGFKSNRPKWMW